MYIATRPPNPGWRDGRRRCHAAIGRALFEDGPIGLDLSVELIRGCGAAATCVGDQEISVQLLNDVDRRIDLQFAGRGAWRVAVIPDDLRRVSGLQIQSNEALKGFL